MQITQPELVKLGRDDFLPHAFCLVHRNHQRFADTAQAGGDFGDTLGTAPGQVEIGGIDLVDHDQAAQAAGVRDLRQSALFKARQGITSLAEINRVTKD